MKAVHGFLVLLMACAFLIKASPAAWAAESIATDPDTNCQIIWVSDSFTMVSTKWSGPVVDGKAQGKGMLMATIRGKDGKELQGQADAEMLAGKLDGKVSIKWSDGLSYNGEYKNGQKNGNGFQKWSNGMTYDGEWKDNNFDGQGTFTEQSGSVYKGGWKNGKRDGKGMFKRFDGQIYEGDIKNDIIEGKGIIRYVNGSVYEGDVANGKPSGSGVLKDPSGKVIYQGKWGGPSEDEGEQF